VCPSRGSSANLIELEWYSIVTSITRVTKNIKITLMTVNADIVSKTTLNDSKYLKCVTVSSAGGLLIFLRQGMV
jgi:hypothetical protein